MAKNLKRKAKRDAIGADILRTLARDKIKTRRPISPCVTYFLSAATTKVEFKLQKVGEGETTRFNSVPIVFIRELTEKRRKVKGRMITETHFANWRPFHNAEPVREHDDCLSLPFVGIKAPLTAWIASGLLDGLIIQDQPKEQREWKRAA